MGLIRISRDILFFLTVKKALKTRAFEIIMKINYY